MERGDIDVHGVGVKRCGRQVTGAKQGNMNQRIVLGNQGQGAARRLILGDRLLEPNRLIAARRIEGTAAAKKRMFAKPWRRVIKEYPTGSRGASDLPAAVARREQCRGAPRGMETGLGFRLDETDAAVSRQLVGHRRTRDSGTDDQEIKSHPRNRWLIRRR